MYILQKSPETSSKIPNDLSHITNTPSKMLTTPIKKYANPNTNYGIPMKKKQARNLRRCALKAGKTSTQKTENLAHLTYLHAESGMRNKSKLGHL